MHAYTCNIQAFYSITDQMGAAIKHCLFNHVCQSNEIDFVNYTKQCTIDMSLNSLSVSCILLVKHNYKDIY